jgi:lipopolysaccharide export system permease protein
VDLKIKERKTSAGSMTNSEIREYLKDNPNLKKSRQIEYRTEITKRYSFSMACLAFAFIAVPLSLKTRRRDTSTGLVVSLLLGAAYFLFSVASSEFKTDLGATLTLWAPNVLCVLGGLFLFRRARFK